MLKNIGARTEPCGTPFLMVYVFDVSLPACGLKLRFVISSCTNRTMHLLRIILVSKAASVSSVSLTTCSTVLQCFLGEILLAGVADVDWKQTIVDQSLEKFIANR